jgi:hypothetical protein
LETLCVELLFFLERDSLGYEASQIIANFGFFVLRVADLALVIFLDEGKGAL